jgi:transposase
MYNLNHDNKKRRNDIYSNASITEILGINDDNLEILDNEKENIKGLDI